MKTEVNPAISVVVRPESSVVLRPAVVAGSKALMAVVVAPAIIVLVNDDAKCRADRSADVKPLN